MGNVLSRSLAVLCIAVPGLLAGCSASMAGSDPSGTSDLTRETSQAPVTPEAVTGPEGLTARGGIVFGPQSAPVTVTVLSDFRCPACRTFHEANSAQLGELVGAGTVRVEHVPVSVLDRFSEGTRFSTRSAGAAYCVAESAPEQFLAFEGALYAHQPSAGTPGLTSEEMAGLAAGVGAGEPTQECIRQDRWVDYATQVTEDAGAAGLRATPTVLLNGEVLGDISPENLRTQIETMAAGDGGS